MEVERGNPVNTLGESQKRKREALGEASPKTKACNAEATSELGVLQELSPSAKFPKEDGLGMRAAGSPMVSGQVAPIRGSLAPAGNRRVQLLHPPSARALAPAGPDDPEDTAAGSEGPDEIQMEKPAFTLEEVQDPKVCVMPLSVLCWKALTCAVLSRAHTTCCPYPVYNNWRHIRWHFSPEGLAEALMGSWGRPLPLCRCRKAARRIAPRRTAPRIFWRRWTPSRHH